MKRPSDAYREGYDKGRNDSVGGVLAEVTMGMLRDDPGGHFAAGYHDGAARKKFNPPPDDVRKGDAELNPFDDKVAIKTVCPNCGALDWFEWKFLGRLKDPICAHTWYVGSGTYTLMQIRAAFQFGRRFARYMISGKSQISASAGEAAVGWVAKGMFWTAGAIIGVGMRLEFGVLMIPIQAALGLFQATQGAAETTGRVVALASSLAVVGIGVYEIQRSSQPQFRAFPQASVIQTPTSRPSDSARSAAAQTVETNLVSWQPEGSWIASSEWDGRLTDTSNQPYHAKATQSAQIIEFGGVIHLLWHERRILTKTEESGGFTADYDAALQFNHQGNDLIGSDPLSARWRTDSNSWQDLNSPGQLTGKIVEPDSIQFRFSWITDSSGREMNGSAGLLRPSGPIQASTPAVTDEPEITGSWTHKNQYESRFTDTNQRYQATEATRVLIERADEGYYVHWYEIRDTMNLDVPSRLGLEFDAIFMVQLQGSRFTGNALYARTHYSNDHLWRERSEVPISASLETSGALQAEIVWDKDGTGKELISSRPALVRH